VGIDRYLLWTDLSAAEKSYLREQFWLSLLNLCKPQLFGIAPSDAVIAGHHLAITAGAEHYLTPFGYEAGISVLMKAGGCGWIAELKTYHSRNLHLPGIDVRCVDRPWRLDCLAGEYSPRLAFWLQPARQRFDAASATPGALAALRGGLRCSRWLEADAELEAKTGGWVARVESLEPALNLRLGLVWQLPR
jgi:hypothetical protein